MFQYRQVLVRMRQGDSDRDIKRARLIFTNSGSRDDTSAIVRRHTGAGEQENGQVVRCRAARGG